MTTKLYKVARTAPTSYLQVPWIATAPSNGFYISGHSSGGTGTAHFARVAANGDLEWSKNLTVSGIGNWPTPWLASNGDSVAVVLYESSSAADCYVALYNAAGTLQWQKKINLANVYGATNGRGIWVDGSANVYLSGVVSGERLLVKLAGTDGSLLWAVETRGTLGEAGGIGPMSVLSGGDLVFMNARAPTTTRSWVQRRSPTDGAVVWTREIAFTENSFVATTVAVDASDNIYAVGRRFDDGSLRFPITKFDSAGTALWSRKVSGATISSGFNWSARAIASASGIIISGNDGVDPIFRHVFVSADGATARVTSTPMLVGTYGHVHHADKNGNSAWYVAPDGDGGGSSAYAIAVLADETGTTDDGVYGPYTRTTANLTIAAHSPTVSSSTFTARSFTTPTVTSTTIIESSTDIVVTPYFAVIPPTLATATGIASTVSFSDDVGVLGAQRPNTVSTTFGATDFYAIAYGDATGIASTVALGTPTFTRNTSRAASSLAPTTAFGLLFSSRGTSGRPAGQVSGLASATVFGASTATATNNRTATGFSSTLIGSPDLALRQAATGLASTAIGSPVSSTGGVAIGWKSEIVFGRPQVGKVGRPEGFTSTVFATPLSRSRFSGVATGFSSTVVSPIGAGPAQRSTRGARFRQTWGLGQTERFLPTP